MIRPFWICRYCCKSSHHTMDEEDNCPLLEKMTTPKEEIDRKHKEIDEIISCNYEPNLLEYKLEPYLKYGEYIEYIIYKLELHNYDKQLAECRERNDAGKGES